MIGFLIPAWVKGVVIVGVVSAAFASGFSVRGTMCERDRLVAEAANREEVIQIGKSQAEVSQRTEVAQIQTQEKIRTIYKTITKEVPVVLRSDAALDCSVSNGWVRLWNSASAGTLPPAAGESDAASSDITSTEILETHIDGAERFARTAAQLEGLQRWVLDQIEQSTKKEQQ